MFHEKTTLVVGAGASKEAGLPVGEELANIIADLMYFDFDFGRSVRGDETFLHAMRKHFKDNQSMNVHLDIARKIWGGIRYVKSIDNYIDAHRHDERIATMGKAAIAYSILKAEKASALWDDPHRVRKRHSTLDKLADTWFARFGQQLVEQVAFTELDRMFGNVKIVCFNYDRCIEEFLAHWLAAVYSIDIQRSRQLVEALPIIRPYGKVAGLATTGFGDDAHLSEVFGYRININTYTEQISDKGLIEAIEVAMSEAEKIVFLGFAFHPQNIKVLAGRRKWQASRIIASAYGFSDSDAKDIEHQLTRLTTSKGSGPRIDVNNSCTCSGLFAEYSRAFKVKA